MVMARWQLAILLALAVLGGCSDLAAWWMGEGYFRYDCQGRLLQSDGMTPLSSASMKVLEARVELVSGGSDLEHAFKTDVARTDATGAYRQTLRSIYAGPTGLHSPKVFQSLFVYVEQPDGWHVYEAKLTKEMQPRTDDGRRIAMPDIIVGREKPMAVVTTHPTTVGSKGE